MSAYGYDSRRRRKARNALHWAAMRRSLRFGIILTLVALAAFAIVYDRLDRSAASHVDFVDHPTTYATTTVSPSP